MSTEMLKRKGNELSREERVKNALWGLFVGDALAMPAHWIYELDNLKQQFSGGLTGYEDAPHPHPESFMVGMGYHPDVDSAQKLGRSYDILHEHSKFYNTSYSNLEIESNQRESAHGNSVPRKEERYHYQHGLKKGENTVEAHLVRVLIRSVAEVGRYDESHFIESFVDFMTQPGSRKDPYTEIYLRSWFENYSRGHAPTESAEHQRNVWSIGSHGGMIRPMVVSLLASTTYQGLGFGIAHQNITHRSENVSAALGLCIPLLHDLLDSRCPVEAAVSRSSSLRVPKLNGHALHELYSSHRGPGNIPHREMWNLHTDLSDERFDLQKMIEELDVEEVVLGKFATACYPEHGVPLMLYLAAKHDFDVRKTLLANANAGGDNVHRGAVLGLLTGAACDGSSCLLELIEGLADRDAIGEEIDAFVGVLKEGKTW